MPYIEKIMRKPLDKHINELKLNSAGQLNYVITKIIHRYLESGKINYTKLNEAIGVLECAKQELYRMVVAPYENEKLEHHGSVSDLDLK